MQHLGLASTMSLIITWGFKKKICSCDFWVEKLLNRFLLLHLKYENENESGQAEHENKHELTEYLEFRKQTNSSGIMSNTIGMRKFNTKYQPTVHSIKQVHTKYITNSQLTSA